MIDIDNIKKEQAARIEKALSSLRQEYENASSEVKEKYHSIISVILERSHKQARREADKKREKEDIERLGLKLEGRVLVFDKGKVLLTPTELKIFGFLAHHYDNPVEPSQLFFHVYQDKPVEYLAGYNRTEGSRLSSIKVLKANLNKKITPFGYHIPSIRGQRSGYCLRKGSPDLPDLYTPFRARLVTIHGVTKTIEEWIDDNKLGLSMANVHARVFRGWAVEKALTTPLLRLSRDQKC